MAGDIFKQLFTRYADLLAIPLKIIFDRVYQTGEWPTSWASETVTVIPKTARPTHLGQLRNLSCTPLFSKVLEHFVLVKLKSEVKLSPSQFGGIKGSGVNHFLIETWDHVLRSLEDSRAAVTLSSIDFEKAFNRMSHVQCIIAAEEMGASQSTLQLLRAFLKNRTMKVKIGNTFSSSRTVPGRSPQGSILANTLFCITIDKFSKCAPRNTPRGTMDRTPDFDENGINVSSESESSTRSPELSPVAPPADLVLGESSEEDEIRAGDFLYFRAINRLEDTALSHRCDQDKIDKALGVPENWEDTPLQIKVYVDDVNTIEKIRQEGSISVISENKRMLLVHSPKTQKMFENVSVVASDMGMIVNQEKTQLLCISASLNDNVASYIRPNTRGQISETISGNELKILGFTFGRSPSVLCHVDKFCKKFRSHLWSLRHLKRNGMSQQDMLDIYKCTLRPVIEFADVTYGPMLTGAMSENIEKLQLRVMKIVYGTEVSYRTIIESGTVERLSARREAHITKFAGKTSRNERYQERWFPRARTTNHNTRKPKKYLEEKARTSRLYNSPIFTMRRLLNSS